MSFFSIFGTMKKVGKILSNHLRKNLIEGFNNEF